MTSIQYHPGSTADHSWIASADKNGHMGITYIGPVSASYRTRAL